MTAGFLAIGTCSFAQDNEPEYEFNKHWFINLQAGGQYTLGETKFGDLLSPTAQVGIGYQFNPWLATRLSVGAWQSKGGWNGYAANSTFTTKTYKYNYVAPAIDVMFNLSNAFCGYNPTRVVNLSAFAGVGANIGFGNDEANAIAKEGYDLRYLWNGTKVRPVGRAGVALDFRVSDRVSLGIEGNANILSDKYNSKKADNADWYFNALASVRINLGKTYTKKAVSVSAPEPAAPAPKPVDKKEEQPAPKPVVKDEGIRRDVFFTINSNMIRESEKAKILELGAYLGNHKDAVIEITGYADAGTGTSEVNDRISSKRAESVKKMLVETCGIDADRIRTSYKGSSVQPFSDNDQNRVSVCIVDQK